MEEDSKEEEGGDDKEMTVIRIVHARVVRPVSARIVDTKVSKRLQVSNNGLMFSSVSIF
jgi:hypothetical protein